MSTALQLVEQDRPLGQALQRQSSSLQLRSLDDLMKLGEVFAKSGYFSDAKDAARAVVKILAGQDMGLSPFAAMNGIFLNNQGRLGYASNLIAAQIKKSGRYDYRIREWTEGGCKIEFFENGQSVGFGEFTKADAQRANLLGKETYKSYPKGLFFARALTQGARAFTPELFGGNAIYTPDEIGADHQGIPAPPEAIEAHTAPSAQSAISDASPWRDEEPPVAVETVDLATLGALKTLWPKYGVKVEDQAVSFYRYLELKKGITDPTNLLQADAQALLEFLQARELAASKPKPAEVAPAGEQKADLGSGLDQWRCTQESGSRALAMDVLNVTKRLEATGIAETEWRAELNDMFQGHELPVSRKSLSAEEIRESWLPALTVWAANREAKK